MGEIVDEHHLEEEAQSNGSNSGRASDAGAFGAGEHPATGRDARGHVWPRSLPSRGARPCEGTQDAVRHARPRGAPRAPFLGG